MDNLQRWKQNSIELALELGYDRQIKDPSLGYELSVFDFIEKTKLKLSEEMPPIGIWYGYTYFSPRKAAVKVHYRNLSTESLESVRTALEFTGLNEEQINNIFEIYENVGKDKFFEIYNQSGMDHEIIGHAYNYFIGQDYDERAAVNTQLELARARSEQDKDWAVITEIMPMVLGHHKDLDELK
jgi:hypothetical protein